MGLAAPAKRRAPITCPPYLAAIQAKLTELSV